MPEAQERLVRLLSHLSKDGWPMGVKKPAERLAASTLTADSLLTMQGLLE